MGRVLLLGLGTAVLVSGCRGMTVSGTKQGDAPAGALAGATADPTEPVREVGARLENTPSAAERVGEVGALLANPPDAMESVEIDAWYGEGYVSWPGRGRQESTSRCPSRDTSPLLDHPLWQTIQVGHESRINTVSPSEPWLIAAAPNYADGKMRLELPAFGRLRGHLGDPAYRHCKDNSRIFVVDEIVQSYEPMREYGWWPVAPVHDWVAYSDTEAGISLRHPPDWMVTVSEGATQFVSPLWPDRPLELTVSGDSEAASVEPGGDWRVFDQHPWGGTPTQPGSGIAGRLVPCIERRDPEAGCVQLQLDAGGSLYVLRQTYGTGFELEPGLLDVMRRIFDSIALDAWPTATPWPPPRTTLGNGPFVTAERAKTQAADMLAGATGIPKEEWVGTAELVSEAAALDLARCDMDRRPDNKFYSHPEAVWVVELTGRVDVTFNTYLGAVNLEHICTSKRVRR